ncbi:uncharacterized protein TrAtP1_007696 [Trichoderma atroviride]|uniref:uncharacterized protein n=1 Tax=Hypocrea atroviridis TaxID=63577 RepID=UPI003322E804|nr:hypothetical protein TrAtP1_007696 [Trichoderma atroviride]
MKCSITPDLTFLRLKDRQILPASDVACGGIVCRSSLVALRGWAIVTASLQ